MHFDPAPSDESRSFESPRVSRSHLIQQTPHDDDAPRGREGLPPAFRMRHGRHYVEQLMGDEPLRTIREIAIAEIEAPPPVDDVDLSGLEASIRAAGVLQPLLLARDGRHYRLIDGASRLRAAIASGLRSVPALIHEVDADAADTLREQASRRAARPATTERAEAAEPTQPALPPAFSEVTAGFGFASALLTALGSAAGDRFRSAVLTDFMAVELQRGRALSASMEVLWQGTPAPSELDGRALIDQVVAAVRPEARLRNVSFEVSVDSSCRLSADALMLSTALAGILHTVLAIVPPGRRLSLKIQATAVRPALIIEVADDGSSLEPEAEKRFFDAGWRQHPAGAAGAVMMAAAERVARLHGGRIEIRASAPAGSVVTFVLPRTPSAS